MKPTVVRLLDSLGRVALDVPVPQHQMTRFAIADANNPAGLINRIRTVVHQTSSPAGDLHDIVALSLERAGRADLANFAPAVRLQVRWSISSFRLRSNCKGEQAML